MRAARLVPPHEGRADAPVAEFLSDRTRHAAGECSHLGAGTDWIAAMGRQSKGARRLLSTRVPTRAGQLLKIEAETLGCTWSDFLTYVLGTSEGLDLPVPIGDNGELTDPRPSTHGRVEISGRVPVQVADLIIDGAQRRGVSYGDHIGERLCALVDVPFTARIKKKAQKQWAQQGAMPMTG